MNIQEYSKADCLEEIIEALKKYDSVLIGAGAGLSAAAGIDYTDTETFAKVFPKMVEKGFTMQYQLIGYNKWTEEEKWAYWATHINHVRYNSPPSPLYKMLHDIVKDKDYYVITSNTDGLFVKSGFNKSRVFEAQGSYDRMRCTVGCTAQTWDTKPFIDKILNNIDYETFSVGNPEALPKCPYCGAPLFIAFRQRENYSESQENYNKWLEESFSKSLLVIEIGVGYNTPGVIRWPFEKIVTRHGDVKFLRINGPYRNQYDRPFPNVPHTIKDKSITICEDARAVIEALWLRTT